MTFTPDPEKISHYPTPRRPYVQFTMNERKFHARVNRWQGKWSWFLTADLDYQVHTQAAHYRVDA